MAVGKKMARVKSVKPPARSSRTNLKQDGGDSVDAQLQAALAWLKAHASKTVRDGMARYGLPSDNALGVSIANIQRLGKQVGVNHPLAIALWNTGIYEARLLTAFVGDPALLTSAQLDRWCRDFDNWGTVDTLCFKLIDRCPLAWKKVDAWSVKRDEFQKRAGFVLLACLAGHDKAASDAMFVERLRLVEQGAADERNFVKKGVSWALRRIGSRNAVLKSAATTVAKRLSQSATAAPRWIGKDALREFASPTRAKSKGPTTAA